MTENRPSYHFTQQVYTDFMSNVDYSNNHSKNCTWRFSFPKPPGRPPHILDRIDDAMAATCGRRPCEESAVAVGWWTLVVTAQGVYAYSSEIQGTGPAALLRLGAKLNLT